MERGAVAGRRAGHEIRIRRRTETAVHCQEYDVEAVRLVDRRPTTDVRRPTAGDRRPTTDDRRPTTDDRRPTTDVRRPTSDVR
jgi:hypothetical protein